MHALEMIDEYDASFKTTSESCKCEQFQGKLLDLQFCELTIFSLTFLLKS